RQYLALPDGTGRFGQDFSGPVLLRGSPLPPWLTSTGLSPSVGRLSSPLRLRSGGLPGALLPSGRLLGAEFGLLPVRSPLLRELLNCSLFPGYLDVSVRRVDPPTQSEYPPDGGWVAPFGYLRIWAKMQLPAAFRSLTRPSSPACA